MTGDAVADAVADIVDSILDCGPFDAGRTLADLGGDSIQAVQILAACSREFGVELPLEAFSPRATITRLIDAVRSWQSAALRGGGEPQSPALDASAGAGEWFRPSPRQEALYLSGRTDPESPMYNVPVALRFEGAMDPRRLRDAVGEVLSRHPALRQVFKTDADGFVRARVRTRDELDWNVLDEPERLASESAVRQWTDELARKPLDLELTAFRAGLAATGERRWTLVLVLHHAVCDGWALNLLLQDLAACYRVEQRDPVRGLAPAAVAARDRLPLDGPGREVLAAKWAELLRGVPESIDLPLKALRAPTRVATGARIPFGIDPVLLARLRSRSVELGTTPFVVLLTAFGLMLGRYTGQDDFVVGVPVANRHDLLAQNTVDYLSATVPVRMDLRGGLELIEQIRRLAAAVEDSSRLAALPLDAILADAGMSRPADRPPLFSTALILLSQGDIRLDFPGAAVDRVDLGTGTAKFDQSWYLEERDGALEGYVEYADSLFTDSTVESMRRHFEKLLTGILAASPSHLVRDIEMFEGTERFALVCGSYREPTEPSGTILDKFLTHVRDDPEAPALWSNGSSTSYTDLYEAARGTAERLVTAGIGPESVVGVCAERGPEQVADVLAVLLTGAAFLPLDPAYPAERLRYMVTDAEVDCVVAGSGLEYLAAEMGAAVVRGTASVGSGPISPTAPSAPPPLSPKSLAYVIYTSGSTGEPKGVELTHDGLANVVDASRAEFGLTRGTRVLQFAPISFDIAVWDIFVTLGTGGTLCLAPSDMGRSELALPELIRRSGAEVLFLTPAVLGILDPADIPSVRTVITGGDRVGADLLQRWARHADFFAAYGPTEGTIVQTWGRYEKDLDGHVPLGHTLPGVRLYVLDQELRPAPIGAIGEVCVGGLAPGRGYRGRPGRTAERFVPDPYAPDAGARMYRTGDLARRRTEDELTFVGRADGQVKVRGHRVELGEVRAALLASPAVTEAAAAVEPTANGQNRLVGYVAGDDIDPARILQTLRLRLPNYLVPTRIVRVAAIPRTTNGKVDYGQLRRASEPPTGLDDAYSATELMSLLSTIETLTDEEADRLLGEIGKTGNGVTP